MSTQINQDFFDGCIYGLVPILFLAVYGTKTAPFLGKIAYLIDDIFVFGLIFIGPFVAMFINKNFNDTYIGLISFTSTYTFFPILMALITLLIFIIHKICNRFLKDRLQFELPTLESLYKLYTHSSFIALTIYLIFQDAIWIAYSFETNRQIGKASSIASLLACLLIFMPYLNYLNYLNIPYIKLNLHIPIEYQFIPIILNLVHQMIWLSLILSNSSYQTKSYMAMTIVAIGRVIFYVTDRDDRPSGGILNFISQNSEDGIESFIRSWRSLLVNVMSEFKISTIRTTSSINQV
ncbi:uncharacterized protein OCT59_003570 [Rhizophagus irregularis]|uniref:Uncharacterized protein n=1 Tax=Rhizophagus irregularis (strain DAOM 181602 / DAOM 197198 / MUCL 43194) TaxID=747089 RepID=U9U8Y7_RHIID|nr:hypothetical protein OCT59_003570 [Rhizophagus irregularis]GBC37559.2 hypothetical protein GLOIN_2v1771635 [Rhizophagus irregularis DAOM 181602=DAOM 197198]CAB5212980.1 unnamed protein product [Rhizophagus irregularis]